MFEIKMKRDSSLYTFVSTGIDILSILEVEKIKMEAELIAWHSIVNITWLLLLTLVKVTDIKIC